jgi:hypothetical protein
VPPPTTKVGRASQRSLPGKSHFDLVGIVWIPSRKCNPLDSCSPITGSAGSADPWFPEDFPIQEDEHLLTVLRDIERNPLRAGLVERAEVWLWSSQCWLAVPAQAPVRLEPGNALRVRDWVERVNAATHHEEPLASGRLCRAPALAPPARCGKQNCHRILLF